MELLKLKREYKAAHRPSNLKRTADPLKEELIKQRIKMVKMMRKLKQLRISK